MTTITDTYHGITFEVHKYPEINEFWVYVPQIDLMKQIPDYAPPYEWIKRLIDETVIPYFIEA